MGSISILLRFAPYIAVVALVVGVGWYTVDSAYEHGRKMERIEWMEHEEVINRQADIRIAQLEYKMQVDRDKADRRATQIIGAYANEIEKLNADLIDAADHRLYITAKASSCKADRDAMSAAYKSPGAPDEEIRFELSAEISRAFRGDFIEAMMLVKKEHALIDLIESKPECFEIVR